MMRKIKLEIKKNERQIKIIQRKIEKKIFRDRRQSWLKPLIFCGLILCALGRLSCRILIILCDLVRGLYEILITLIEEIKHFPEFWQYPERNQTEIQLQSDIEAWQNKIASLATQIRLQREEFQSILTPEILDKLAKEVVKGKDLKLENRKFNYQLSGSLTHLDKQYIGVILRAYLENTTCKIPHSEEEDFVSRILRGWQENKDKDVLLLFNEFREFLSDLFDGRSRAKGNEPAEIQNTNEEDILSAVKIQSWVRITHEVLMARLEQEIDPYEIDRQSLIKSQQDREAVTTLPNDHLSMIFESDKCIVGVPKEWLEHNPREVETKEGLSNQQLSLLRKGLDESSILKAYCYLWLANEFKCTNRQSSLRVMILNISELEAKKQNQKRLLDKHISKVQEVRDFRNLGDLLKRIGVIVPIIVAAIALIPLDPLIRPAPTLLWKTFAYKNLTERISVPQFGTPMNSALNTIYQGLPKIERAEKNYYYNPYNVFFNQLGGNQTSEGLASLLLFGVNDPFTDENDMITKYKLDNASIDQGLTSRSYHEPYAVPISRKDLFNIFTMQIQVKLKNHLLDSQKIQDSKKRPQVKEVNNNDSLQYCKSTAPTYSLTDLGDSFSIISQYSPYYVYDLFKKEQHRYEALVKSYKNIKSLPQPQNTQDGYSVDLPSQEFIDDAIAYLKTQAQTPNYKSDDNANKKTANRFFMGINQEGKYGFLKPDSINYQSPSRRSPSRRCQKIYHKGFSDKQTVSQFCGEFMPFPVLNAIEYYMQPSIFRLSKSLSKDPVYNSLSDIIGDVDRSNLDANRIRQLFYNARITSSIHIITSLPRTFDDSEIKKILEKEEVKPFGKLMPETDEVDRMVQEFVDQEKVVNQKKAGIPGLMAKRFRKIVINSSQLGCSEEQMSTSVERVYVFFREDI
jgi:hypothetical protein